jgi:Zn-dependent peptidase ImmA (M78 family)/DNA-binding XRE family transcriptional regulator
MTRADAGFEPARLRLARELRGWNQAELARRVELSSAAISQFESGSTLPSQPTLDRLASTLELHPGFFGLPLVDTHEGFFRSLRRTSLRQRRRARAIAHVAHDTAVALEASDEAQTKTNVRTMPIDDLEAGRSQIEEVAARVRSLWRLPSGPIANVVELLEIRGVVVIRLPLETHDVDAFSLPFPDRPVVVLAADKGDRARSRFDAAHELGHLVMHGDQFWGIKQVEQQANWFAAEFLMPANDIRDELPERADWPALFELKRKWQVSLAALLMRARNLGRMSPEAYLSAVKETSARGWRRVEPIPLGDCEVPSQSLLAAMGSRTASSQYLPLDVLRSLA